MKNSPLAIIISGNVAVEIFFILSGFVLPLSWFKSRSYTSIYGGIFRRYMRLAIPMMLTLSIYYIIAKLDLTSNRTTLAKVKSKSFFEFIMDTIIGVWVNNTDITGATWTLGVELFASYFIYLIALVPIHYNGRWWIYALVILFTYIPRFTDAYHFTQYGFDTPYFETKRGYHFDKILRFHLPTFAFGVIFADLECVNINGRRPLDVIRKLPLWVKVPFNISLFTLFAVFGTVDTEYQTWMKEKHFQKYSLSASFGYTIGFPMCMLIAGLAMFILCLTSRVAQIILAMRPF